MKVIMNEKYDEDYHEIEVNPGDLVDFGHYGHLYIVRDLGDSYWVSDRPNDESGWSIKKYLAKKVIKSSGNDDIDYDESKRVRVDESAGEANELYNKVVDKMELLLDAFHDGRITDDELMDVLHKLDDDLNIEGLDEAIPAIIAAIGSTLATDAASKLANEKF